jgi:hypothetical protein
MFFKVYKFGTNKAYYGRRVVLGKTEYKNNL